MRRSEAGVTLLELLVAVTLLSLLSLGMLFAMRAGLDSMGKTNDRVMDNRRVLGVDRAIGRQIAGYIPTTTICQGAPNTPAARIPFFQGEPQTMRFVSSFSLQEGARGYPQVLEYQVIPGEDGIGVRLIVNESLYAGLSSAGYCAGTIADPATGRPMPLFRPVQAGAASFVLADKLASCQFAYKEERELPQPDLWLPRWVRDQAPAAVRIDMVPLPGGKALALQMPGSIVEPLRPTRHALSNYLD